MSPELIGHKPVWHELLEHPTTRCPETEHDQKQTGLGHCYSCRGLILKGLTDRSVHSVPLKDPDSTGTPAEFFPESNDRQVRRLLLARASVEVTAVFASYLARYHDVSVRCKLCYRVLREAQRTLEA